MRAAADLPSSVLFACTMNAVRSPMAAAILLHLAGNRVYVASAGVREGEHDPFVDAVMEEIGIDVSRHEPQMIADLFDTSFDLIISGDLVYGKWQRFAITVHEAAQDPSQLVTSGWGDDCEIGLSAYHTHKPQQGVQTTNMVKVSVSDQDSVKGAWIVSAFQEIPK